MYTNTVGESFKGVWNVKIRKLFQIGILNTLRINFTYFSWSGILHPYILVSRKTKLIELKGNIIINRPCIGGIKIGFQNVDIFDPTYERTLFKNSGTINFAGKAEIGAGSRIANSGNLIIGDRFIITAKSSIVCKKAILFGDEVLISWDCLVMDTDFHKIFTSDGSVSNLSKKIVIGNHVWIGCRCLILKDSEIPNNSIIAAASTITKKFFDEGCVIGNNKILERDISWTN